MVVTLEEYGVMPMSLTMEELAALHREMAKEIGSDTDALELYGDLLAAAVKYLEYRSNWPLWGREEKMEKDPVRTWRHNRVILCLNQLAKYLRMQGKNAAWRDTLGEETQNPACRKRAGDFACYLGFVESLCAR